MTISVEGRRTDWIPDDSTFGARLALVRQRMSWGNVKEAADACGLAVESWRRWERDGRAPRDVLDIAGKIADRTGCSYAWLLEGPRMADVHRSGRSGATQGYRRGGRKATRTRTNRPAPRASITGTDRPTAAQHRPAGRDDSVAPAPGFRRPAIRAQRLTA